MSEILFPLWQVDREEYAAVCAYLGLTPSPKLFERLSDHLAQAPFRVPRPKGLSLFLARPPLTRFRIARLDLVTKLWFPAHPARQVLNAIIALHECDGRGFREMAAAPTGAAVWPAMLAWGVRCAFSALLTSFWLAWQAVVYAASAPFRTHADLHGKRVLITGVNRGLGRDLLLHCLESGANVVGTVRTDGSRIELRSALPVDAPVSLVVADLSHSGAVSAALQDASVAPESIDIMIACAGVKHAGTDALSSDAVRQTFEVNFFSAAELTGWICRTTGSARGGQRRRTALVLVSSIGRWHGMQESGGYNASKAALSIWGESLEMDLHKSGDDRFTVTIVEPGLFDSGMTRQTALIRRLFASRRQVAERIVGGAVAGRRTIRPPFWFALLTWGVCLAGRSFRSRLFARAKPGVD